MELKMIKLAVERLYNEVEALKMRNKELELKIQQLKLNPVSTPLEVEKEDELIDTKYVLKYLGICYNTLQGIIDNGLIQPIRIGQRRIRFSKKGLMDYVRGRERLKKLN